MVTHIVFGAGSAVAILASVPFDLRLLLAGSTSLFVNLVIDEIGHTVHGGFVARSPLTHSVFTAPVWGGIVGYALWVAVSSLDASNPSLVEIFVAAGIVVAFAHLFLDLLTEKGIYLMTERLALAHFRSDNASLNGIFIAIGFLLFL